MALQGVEEHALRGVDPVAGLGVGARVAFVVGRLRGGVGRRGGDGGIGAGDGADFAVGG